MTIVNSMKELRREWMLHYEMGFFARITGNVRVINCELVAQYVDSDGLVWQLWVLPKE